MCHMQEEADWATAKRVLGQPKFIERLMTYDADNIPDAVLEALQRVVTDARFTADQVTSCIIIQTIAFTRDYLIVIARVITLYHMLQQSCYNFAITCILIHSLSATWCHSECTKCRSSAR